MRSVDRLLTEYPGDSALLSFRQEIQTRSDLQRHSDVQQKALDRERNRAARRRRLAGALITVIVLGAAAWVVITYRAAARRERLAAEATQTAEALAHQRQTADTLMIAGQPEKALALYSEIQKTDPTYVGIDRAIQSAQTAIKVEGLYQQGTQAAKNGDIQGALTAFEQVLAIQPGYKDAAQLVAGLKLDEQKAALLRAMQGAYAQGDSLGVIKNFEAIQAIDANFDDSNLRDELFASYSDLVLQIAREPDPTLDDIRSAVRYYRAATALFPQSIQYSRQQAELQDAAVGLLATQYSLQGISTLQSSDYSIQGLQASILALQRARQNAPGSAAVAATLDKAQAFITSYDYLVRGEWDAAITGFEDIYRQEANFANGRVRYFLYEAYTSRGDLLMLDGNFSGAYTDYQSAEKYAWEDQQNSLRVFEIEVRLGFAAHKMAKYDQAAQFYHSGFAQAGYRERLTTPSQQDLLQNLIHADSAFAQGSMINAVNLYEQAVKNGGLLYSYDRVSAFSGDTLPSIGFDTGSTLWSLRNANSELGDGLILSHSMQLSVPVFSPTQK